MAFLSKPLARLAACLSLPQELAGAVARQLPTELILVPGRKSNPEIVVNINLCAAADATDASESDVADCCSPWWGLEGYDIA